MTTISIITQISIYDIFGEIGCAVNVFSIRFHAKLLIISGFGMAIFRIACIENLAKQVERKKLVKIIHFVEFVVIIMGPVTMTIFENCYSLWWNPDKQYPFCKDYGVTKADIFQTYNGYCSENEEFGE